MGILNKILAGVTAFFGVLLLVFKGKYEKEKMERAEEEVDRVEAVSDAKERATEAMVRGLENESKPTNGRTHNFND
jgi:hypothetical protein